MYLAYVPEIREFVIAILVLNDGRVLIGCFNITGFQIPPGVPDSILVLVVRNLLQIRLLISGRLYLAIRLTVGGRLHCPDGTVVEDEKTQVYDDSEDFQKYVQKTRVKDAIRVGEEQASLDMELRGQIKASIVESHFAELTERMTLVCPNAKPTVGIRPLEHSFPGGTHKVTVFGSDYEDGGNVSISYTVSGGAEEILGDARYPRTEYVEGGQKYVTFYVRATGQPGSNFTVRATATDTAGRASDPAILTVPIVEDVF